MVILTYHSIFPWWKDSRQNRMTELHLILSSKLASTSVYLTTFIREDSDGFIHVYFSCFPRFVSLSTLLEGVSVVRDDVDCCCG